MKNKMKNKECVLGSVDALLSSIGRLRVGVDTIVIHARDSHCHWRLAVLSILRVGLLGWCGRDCWGTAGGGGG